MTGEGTLFQIRGKKLYVETHGKIDSPPLLYLHGGPGEGCYEYMYIQRERLSKQLYLIGIDQRGVWRSDEIKESESFSLQDVVKDCEALRETLGIKKWSILGHSFGGYLALLYGLNYSNSIQTLFKR